MYITAQRVLAASSQEEGINAFLHKHSISWTGTPPKGIPEQDPGALVDRHVEIPPGGNRVRSYLDIIAPETIAWSSVREQLLKFVASKAATAFPWVQVRGNLKFVVNMDSTLAASWQTELAQLYQAALRVRS